MFIANPNNKSVPSSPHKPGTPVACTSKVLSAKWLVLLIAAAALIFSGPESSPSYLCTSPIQGYISGPDGTPDCTVDFFDLESIAHHWLQSTGPAPIQPADIDGSTTVDFNDFAIMASHWAKSNLEPPWSLCTIDDLYRGTDGVRLADVNYDSLVDITTGWEEAGITKVYLHPGYAAVKNSWPVVTVGQTPAVEDAVFVDLDNDGAFDVVSSCEGDTMKLFVSWVTANENDYLDYTTWTTEPLPASAGLMRWMFCVPVQFDGANGLDLIAGGKNDAQIGWFQAAANPRSLSSFQFHSICGAGWIMSIILSDMDADGDLDIVVSDRKQDERGLRGC